MIMRNQELISALCAVFLAGVLPAQAQPDPRVADLVTAGKIRMGVFPSFQYKLEERIREALAVPGRPGIRVIAKQFGVSPRTVQNEPRLRVQRRNQSANSSILLQGPWCGRGAAPRLCYKYNIKTESAHLRSSVIGHTPFQ
jgi:hypothetical protein